MRETTPHFYKTFAKAVLQQKRCVVSATKGFTLIEIILSLVLVGVISTIAGMGIVTFTQSYLFTLKNGHMAQKAQLATARISREILELKDIAAKSDTQPDPWVIYDSITDRRAIAKNDDTLLMYFNLPSTQTTLPETGGYALVDDLDTDSGLSLEYFAGSLTWDGSDIRELSAVRLTLKMVHSNIETGAVNFTTTVHLRNNNNYGGAAPASSFPSKSDYGCFIATAVFGNEYHPAVTVLKTFRDRILLRYGWGKWLVNQYYRHSPGLAARISKHGWLKRCVRIALAPIVGLSFLCLNRPWAIPLFILFPAVAILICRLLPSLAAGRFTNKKSSFSGSVFIGLIMTMVIFSALGGAMVSSTFTLSMIAVDSNKTAKAYFLAESGLRYAASQYLNQSGDTARDDELETLHGSTFTLSGNDGSFTLDVAPYYFRTTSNPSGSTTLATEVPGGFPEEGLTFPSTGRLKIESSTYDYDGVSTTDPNVVTFTTTSALPTIPIDTPVYSVAPTVSQDQSLASGGNLFLQTDYAMAFPPKNGIVLIGSRVLTYEALDIDNDRLVGLTDPNDDAMATFTVPANTDIMAGKFIKFTSTGTYNDGESDTSREVTYYLPLPTSPDEKTEFVESFDNKDNWESTYGTHTVSTIDGDKALTVASTESISGIPKASLIQFKPSEDTIDLETAYRTGDKYFLSYDAQVKVGFQATPAPDYGFDPSPIPLYFMGGLVFRLDSDLNAYGLSWLRGSSSTAPTPDNIDDPIVPLDQTLMLVLWQQKNSGTTRNWLAYKNFDSRTYLEDDVESGTGEWSATGLWNDSTRRSHSSPNSWYYGNDATGNYNVGATTGSLTIDVDLCHAQDATLEFWTWYETESEGNLAWVNTYDLKYVDIYDGTTWHNNVYQIRWPDIAMRTWTEISPIDLSAYVGNTIKVRFRFDTLDGSLNNFEGWYVDDIKITGSFDFPIEESTLMVRLIESASVVFNTGGTDAIEDGYLVTGQTSGAIATVKGNPVLSSGSWAGGDAAGTLLLENVSGTFEDGETLSVGGISATAVVSGTPTARANFIRAFYGENTGCGTPGTDFLDEQRHALERNPSEINWPPDEVEDWSADLDYFTLVQWDAVNTATVSSLSTVSSTDEPDAILRSTESVLLSPDSGNYSKPELGLHTFGKGAANLYFDDFAVQAEIYTVIRAAPIQE